MSEPAENLFLRQRDGRDGVRCYAIPPTSRGDYWYTREEALLLAAHLVRVADPQMDDFSQVLEQVLHQPESRI